MTYILKKMILKIHETKSWFFEMVKKINEPFIRLINKKKEKTKISKIRNERESNNSYHRNTKDCKKIL